MPIIRNPFPDARETKRTAHCHYQRRESKCHHHGAFIKKYRLPSSSSVQSALKGLLEKDFVTQEAGAYQIYDRFFGLWLQRNY